MYNTEGMTKEKLDYMEDPGILIVQNGTSEDTRRDLPNTSYISNTVCKNFLMEAQSRVFQLKKVTILSKELLIIVWNMFSNIM